MKLSTILVNTSLVILVLVLSLALFEAVRIKWKVEHPPVQNTTQQIGKRLETGVFSCHFHEKDCLSPLILVH